VLGTLDYIENTNLLPMGPVNIVDPIEPS